jgi:hypothetical protein
VAEETLFLSVYTFFEDFSAAQPFLLQQVNNQLVHDFLSQQNNRFFFFFLSLWIYLWLAETSQQPICQTTWLKVTPHCNHSTPFFEDFSAAQPFLLQQVNNHCNHVNPLWVLQV